VSVPFEFDVHALIETENAPALEHKIHKQLLSTQMNKINSRKEFFPAPPTEIHRQIENLESGVDFNIKIWTEKAIATEYKETLDIENDPQKKEVWLQRQQALSARQLQLDVLSFPNPTDAETEESIEKSEHGDGI
jgi:hypothetical protein